MISNLDWTPTLLQFAGYLDDIQPADITWDGVSQYDMIVNDKEIRDHIVLNIGDTDMNSAAILLKDDGNLYKYIVSTPGCIADRWIYSPLKRVVDSWSINDKDTGARGFKLEDNKREPFSQEIDSAYLFDLTYDQRELYNLLNEKLPHFDGEHNDEIIGKCKQILGEWVADNDLFSSPMSALHDRLEQGEPTLLDDGKFVRPFLNDEEYKLIINNMFDDDVKNGVHHSDAQKRIYLHRWQCPKNKKKKDLQSLIGTDNRHNHMDAFVLAAADDGEDEHVVLSEIKSQIIGSAPMNLSSMSIFFIVINAVAISCLLIGFLCFCVNRKKCLSDRNEYADLDE